MKRIMKRSTALALMLVMLCTIVPVVSASEMPHSRDIDVVVKKIADGYANVYSATVSLWNSGSVQAGEFAFSFSSRQLLSSTSLKVHRITSSTEGYDWFVERMSSLGGKIAPFDIYAVSSSGERTGFSRSVSVNVTLPDTYQDTALYLLEPNGSVAAISLTASGSSCSFTVSQDGYYVFVDRAEAAEGRNYHTVTASAEKGGSISPSGAQLVEEGTEMMFTIAAEDGYKITDVLVDGTSVGTVESYTFYDIQADHTIEASFERTEVNIGTIVEDIFDWLIGGWFNP